MATTAAYAPHPPKPVTRFSDLGTPEEKTPWWAPFGFILVVISTSIILGLLIALSPILIIEILIHRLVAKGYKYHRQPSDLKIAIVGAGWAGLQSVARFRELGTTDVTVFERYDDVGGTWHPNLRYHGLQIHGSMVITSFDKYPYSTDFDTQHGKVLAEEVENYIHKYTKEFDLLKNCKLNSNVDEVQYDSKTGKATMVISDTKSGEKRTEGPYDLVIWASTAAFGTIPKIPGTEKFKGKVLHTTGFQNSEFEAIVQQNKKVVVVGGGKAGADLVIGFVRNNYHNFKWIMRKPYLFYKFEVLFHNGSLLNSIRGFTYLATMLWAAVSNKFSTILHWCSGYLVTYGKPHLDHTHFHGGILCPTQRKDIKDIPWSIGEPKELTENGVILADGTEVECDVLIWATGNKTGMETLNLVKDGQPYKLNPKAKLYNHYILPDFPALASATAFFTTFGPLRGTNTAELTVYHFCVRGKRTEAQMMKAANRQISKNSPLYTFLWTHDGNWIQQWVYFHLDLLFAGVTSLEDFLSHALIFFALSKDNRLRLNILPPEAPN